MSGIVLSGGELDTLVALVEAGPLWDGDVPSKSARDSLIERGLAIRVVVKLEDGFTAATYRGRDAYEEAFGAVHSLRDARANRLAQRAIMRASWSAGTPKVSEGGEHE